ncbi:MAG: helix-turn-helix transcriptional regulator [Candidatus Omnitrophica bacterium]|nr:helix-turn-helix transcriptional regulator [Candidatus Omnitrophota bacterium]
MNKEQQFENIFKCKWSTLVLEEISRGTKQPGILLRSIPGLTKKVLYQRLKKLEKFNYIKRQLIAIKPLKVHYTLQPAGRAVLKIIKMIRNL